jgi:dTDP-4-dehydrorhamnose 3,5-epimerase
MDMMEVSGFSHHFAELSGSCTPRLLCPKPNQDDRGYFYESWNQGQWDQALGCSIAFVQDNHSCSRSGVLRGLHYQIRPYAQAKLVRCIVGEIFDVAVDLRIGSPSFKGWCGVMLSSVNHHQLWVPEGFAHGFLTLSESAEVLYKTSSYWSPDHERSIRWDDPQLAIDWPLQSRLPCLSDKDANAPLLAQVNQEDLFL